MGNTIQRLKGKIKEQSGRARGDAAQVDRGRRDQVKGNLKKSAQKARDALRKL
jgi:uncharacterized protein YjbJ (UPF0337 family)